MAIGRGVDVFESYERFVKGPKMTEQKWDYEIIPKRAKMLKEAYGLDFKNNIIPTDSEQIDNLFLAGMDILLTCGIFNPDVGRVMNFKEEEIYQGLKMAPKRLVLGEGKEKCVLKPRHGNDVRMPIVIGGPTGAPVSERLFESVITSYAQEPMVNGIVSGVISSIQGNAATTNSPWEIKATMAEIRHVREATSMAGRPGMCI